MEATRPRSYSDNLSDHQHDRENDASECDNDSVCGQTNFNWKQPRQPKQKPQQPSRKQRPQIINISSDEEVPAKDFYESAHFFIENLKDEFCEKTSDGWHRLESLPEEAPGIKGKWLDEEHQRFLEGLKLYGKDWTKVHAYVKTRSLKNVISHGQKFFVSLVQFLDKGRPLRHVSQAEADFFYGILSKKAKYPDRRKALAPKLEQIFKVERLREHRPSRKVEVGSEFEKWRESLDRSTRSFHSSLGVSVKVTSGKGSSIKFKSLFINAGESQEDEDSDSAASQSSAYLRKYNIDERFIKFGRFELNIRLFEKFLEDFNDIEDLKSIDDPRVLFWRLENGQEFEVFKSFPIGFYLRMRSKNKTFLRQIISTHPTLFKKITTALEEKMDTDSCMDHREEDFPLMRFIRSFSEEELEQFLDSKTCLFYK